MANTRKRLVLACDACRARRTKCDGLKPSCHPCRARGLDCFYQELPQSPPSKVESELAAMNQRLDYICDLLGSQPAALAAAQPSHDHENVPLSVHEDSPFRLLATSSIMLMLGLDADLPQTLIRLERVNFLAGSANSGSSRLFFVPHEQATSALAAFSELIHGYFPILPLNFSEEYFRILSEPLVLSSQSCLVFLVAAIGRVAEDPKAKNDNIMFDVALLSLPLVVSECSLTSVQCLILLSIYYACLLKPCQAHDYCLVASFKIQNLFKSNLQDTDPDVLELTHRAYWAVLLLESELSIQLDVAKSNIWSLNYYVPLPNCLSTWKFSSIRESPPSPRPDETQAFFLAEIAMRRMLHRCNSAVTLTPTGQAAYAPGIALELERQLDEWYDYLPDVIRFPRDCGGLLSNKHIRSLPNFLRVQYYCCKLSIYWPAVCQAIQDGVAGSQLRDHCQWFFDCYVHLVPSIELAYRDCRIHKWTLFLSIFITTMTVLKASETPCLSDISRDQLRNCLLGMDPARWDTGIDSASLRILRDILGQRLAEAKNHV